MTPDQESPKFSMPVQILFWVWVVGGTIAFFYGFVDSFYEANQSAIASLWDSMPF